MKYLIDGDTLKGLADALRSVTGATRSYTPTEMIEAVTNIMETGSYILVDENGVEIPAVFVENKQVFTATANDIRIGTIAVTESGITEGTKEIPAYYVSEGWRMITNGSPYKLPLEYKGYTKLQAIITPFNTSLSDSVAAERVVIGDKVYQVKSITEESAVTVDEESGYADLGITNSTGSVSILRYFSYKEMY